MMINVMITTAGRENGGEAGRRRRRRRRWKAGMGGGGGGNGRGRSRMMDALSERRTNEKRNDINDVHTHSAKRGGGGGGGNVRPEYKTTESTLTGANIPHFWNRPTQEKWTLTRMQKSIL